MDSKRNLFLAQRLISGDSKAYDFLMDFYYQNLCGYAQSLCNDRDMSEDIVQNVFVKIWVKRKKINPDLSIKSYLYKSVYNEFINQYRKNIPVIYLESHITRAFKILTEKLGTKVEAVLFLLFGFNKKGTVFHEIT